MKTTIVLLSLICSIHANAQLPDGSIAPDFTLTDIVDSNSHNLYEYLDDGKTVFIEIFAAHCPSCWGYHQANTLKDLYNSYGPNGSDEVMVLALEYDEYNFYDAFIGIGPAWVTAGNWLDGTPYPIFQVEGGDRSIFDNYNVTFYPVVYMVCPNRSLKRVSTSLNANQLYDDIADCSWLTLEEEALSANIYIDNNKSLVIENTQTAQSVQVTNMGGQNVLSIDTFENGTISLEFLENGIYLFSIQTDFGPIVKRLLVD